MKSKVKYIIFICFIFFFQGCSKNSSTIKQFFQTNNIIQVENNYKEICTLIAQYKIKLDKRNPKAFNKIWEKPIIENIKSLRNNIDLSNYKDDYKKYLQKTFSQNTNIQNRNDFLILGIYKLLYVTYNIKDEKFTTLDYQLKDFQKLSEILQAIHWKIKNLKDKGNNYLFLTWQKNWQIQFAKITNNKNPDYNLIKNLDYIKQNKETIFQSSNMSFEKLFHKIIYKNNDSIKRLGGEPSELSLSALKLILFI